ncbi:MAG: hypothetical protein ABR928_21340 [Terracidiphilus sp.]|jgi:hypothetical protein
MAIIVVGGSAKDVGKTMLVCGLIAALDSLRWTAVKITSDAHKGLPPIYEEKHAGPESDTARYLAAGADRAFLLTIPQNRDLTEALDEFWPLIGRGANLIFESNLVAGVVNAEACLLVQGDPRAGAGKPSYYRAAQFADALVAQGDDDRMVADAMKWEGKPRGPIFNLKQLDRISAEMKGWLEKRPGLRS